LLGNALGGATISFLQATVVFVISMALGFRINSIGLMLLGVIIAAALSLALTSFGAGIASIVDDFQGFNGINQFLIFPLFFLSSALYPLTNAPDWLRFLASINPLSYAVDALRYCFIGQTHFGLGKDLIVLAVTVIVCVGFAVNRFDRMQI
jgi:ABC-2 type transport system permease protein